MAEEKEYTAENLQYVQDILRTKDYYSMLKISKEADENQLKKAYRKIALKTHPDKNKAPKAEEAFKKVAAAYDCLSNPEKKRRYDLTGDSDLFAADADQRQGHGSPFGNGGTYYYSGNIDPNDIFASFFGTDFGFFDGMGQQGQRRRYQQRRRPANEGENPPKNFVAMLIQFFPIIIILSYLVFSPLFMPAQAYSFTRTNTFPHMRTTSN